jgi:hypothetical protein
LREPVASCPFHTGAEIEQLAQMIDARAAVYKAGARSRVALRSPRSLHRVDSHHVSDCLGITPSRAAVLTFAFHPQLSEGNRLLTDARPGVRCRYIEAKILVFLFPDNAVKQAPDIFAPVSSSFRGITATGSENRALEGRVDQDSFNLRDFPES